MIARQTFESYPVFGDNATKVMPDNGGSKYSNGFQQSDVLPAEWMNWAWNKNTKGITDLNEAAGSVEDELINVLNEAGITPSGSSTNQVYKAVRKNCGCIMASSKTITDAPSIDSNNIVKIMFTADITGSDTTTGMTITYNGTGYPVKACKDGSLVDFKAHTISGSTKYIQANTIIEFVFDGANFVIIGNPVVLSGIISGAQYKIHANGSVGDEAVGTVKPWPSTAIPYGWAICDHQAVSRSLFPDLYALLGTFYGSGDGSTTFNLPDYRETTLVGIGTNTSDSIADHDSFTIGQFKDDQFQEHMHYYNDDTISYDTSSKLIYGGSSLGPLTTVKATGTLTGRYGTTTRTKEKGVNYIIKLLA